MELAELKKELYSLIERTEDEQTLLEAVQIIRNEKPSDYEETNAFWDAISEARVSIADGKGVSDVRAREMINSRFKEAK